MGAIDTINHQFWTDTRTTGSYTDLARRGLFAAEQRILGGLQADLSGKAILDIGVGAGRTTAYLLGLSKHYTAIDYSAEMVRIVRREFAIESVYECDARDLSRFADGSFDFVFFSFNGIDLIDRAGRLQVLSEVHRVLRPNGRFLFSSHNREWRDMERGPRLAVHGLRHCVKIALLLPRKLRLRKLELRTPDHAITAHHSTAFGLLIYWITARAQCRELRNTGFNAIEIFDAEGSATDGNSPESPWLYFLCRKPEHPT